MKEIVVLRYGHRHVRDQRVTTHCCLVARAFQADKIIIQGEEDKGILETITKMNDTWGGVFSVLFVDSWKKTLEEYKQKGFFLVHLTMYGAEYRETIPKLRKKEKMLIVIGSQKVEREVYDLCDWNISITTQPHSEIAALGVFLDNLLCKTQRKAFNHSKIKITPTITGKNVKKQ